MGNFLSGAHARLILTGRAHRAACLYTSDTWPKNLDVLLFCTGGPA